MDQPYFATYTGCDDLFLVCRRDHDGRNPLQYSSHPTMEDAQAHAAAQNISTLANELDSLADGPLTDDNTVNLYEAARQLTDLLHWDLGVYQILRDRDLARQEAMAAKLAEDNKAAD